MESMRSRPRFAPVFLDEGFVKADSEFAGRAVRAWKGLGFQLVVGVPQEQLEVVDKREMVDISLQHLLAVMLLDGTMSFAAAHDLKRVKDPAVLKTKKLIEAVADQTIPNAVRGWRGRISVKLKDGRTIEHETLAAKGTAENPLTREDVTEKSLDLMVPALGRKRSMALINALFDLDKMPNVRALRRLYSV